MRGRILVFGEYGTLNGGENSLLAVLPALQERGWSFTAAVPADSAFAHELEQLGIANLGIELFDQRGTRLAQQSIRKSIRGLIERTEPDLVHCNSLSTSRLVGPLMHESGIPAVGTLRDILKLSKTAMADINQLDRIIVVSKATRDWHERQGLDITKTEVIYNAVHPNRFFPADTAANLDQLGIRITDPVLLFVGQIGMRKGVDILLRVFAIVQSQIKRVQLLIVGIRHSQKQEAIDFENKALLHSQAISNDRSAVHWLGRRGDVCLLMNRADLLIHPARQEPLGRVLLEALACGLPFVATDVGGTREILDGIDNSDQLLAPADNVDELARKIVGLLKEEAKLEDFRHQFRQQAVTKFSIESCANQLDALYEKLILGSESS